MLRKKRTWYGLVWSGGFLVSRVGRQLTGLATDGAKPRPKRFVQKFRELRFNPPGKYSPPSPLPLRRH
ncbi:uncharacterized protein DFL_001000 [Arthrobotrys flagrans]|uniref:Uncharacterized protein n=1 Tax=Arthrobotrys flagrans TaxID=97331 RepID=A0A437AFW0_ARTFL|nr:hypothetical protein DFL_001000 [Arthrobotrys flagrans]